MRTEPVHCLLAHPLTSCSSPPLGGEARRGGSARSAISRSPLSPPLPPCTDRRHREHLCGDIAYTFRARFVAGTRGRFMPWLEASVMELREEFVGLALAPGANVSDLCRRFGIERSTGHKWLKRYRSEGASGIADRSRRPHASPSRTDAAVEAEVLRIRAASNNAWGGRKIAWTMSQAGCETVPAASTISDILRRHGKLDRGAQHPGPHVRFERAEPNELWQMDFKGHFAMASGRCHPLTVLDDHSRYSLGIEACGNEQDGTVRASPDHAVSPLRPAFCDADGQRLAVGRQRRRALHRVHDLADAPWHPGQPWPSLPSPDARQDRAVPSLAEGRGPRAQQLCRSAGLPEGVRQMAPDLQWRTAARSARRRAAGQPLPPQPTPVPREPAADRLWLRRHRPQGR